jgi:hypothetical protein
VQRTTPLVGQVVSFVPGNDAHPSLVWHEATVRVPPWRGKQSGHLPHVVDPPEARDEVVRNHGLPGSPADAAAASALNLGSPFLDMISAAVTPWRVSGRSNRAL